MLFVTGYPWSMPSPEFRALGVSPGASLEEIKTAFRRRALALHPDHNPDPAAARHFRHLTESYRLLEAQALARQPHRTRPRPLKDQVSFVLIEVRSMLDRWSSDQWSRVVDGLSCQVWVVSLLDVLTTTARGTLGVEPVGPHPAGLEAALAACKATFESWTELDSLPRRSVQALSSVVRDAQDRLAALRRPSRNSIHRKGL